MGCTARKRHRIEWLIEGLGHKDGAIRQSAAEDLRDEDLVPDEAVLISIRAQAMGDFESLSERGRRVVG